MKRPRLHRIGRPRNPVDARKRERAKSDRTDRWVQALIAALIIASAFWYWFAYQKATDAANATHHEALVRGLQRTEDLRASCRRGSQARAADVNLNWVYYQSEVELNHSGTSPRRIEALLAALSPAERRFLSILIAGSKPSRKILAVRASADFNAAYVKAHLVDYRDLAYVAPRTPLGSERTPRRWVRSARYSCDTAFR